MDLELPQRGFVFWPVGNGDSTTVLLDTDTWMQVDLHHLECADESKRRSNLGARQTRTIATGEEWQTLSSALRSYSS